MARICEVQENAVIAALIARVPVSSMRASGSRHAAARTEARGLAKAAGGFPEGGTSAPPHESRQKSRSLETSELDWHPPVPPPLYLYLILVECKNHVR